MDDTKMKTYVPSSSEEEKFLNQYDPSAFPAVAVTVDVALLTIKNGKLCVLLVRRADYPYKDCWALPGGFTSPGETLVESAARELLEETNLNTFPGHLEQLQSYGNPNRDPRMHVVSVAYLALLPEVPPLRAGSDAAEVRFFPVEDLDLETGVASPDGPALAFDHNLIISDAVERARSKLEYTPLAASFTDKSFTLADLRRVYEAVWGTPVHAANFRRKVLSTPGFVAPVGKKGGSKSPEGRQAELYERGDAELLHPAMLRPKLNEE